MAGEGFLPSERCIAEIKFLACESAYRDLGGIKMTVRNLVRSRRMDVRNSLKLLPDFQEHLYGVSEASNNGSLRVEVCGWMRNLRLMADPGVLM